MADYKDILQRIYSASNDGLDIIIGELPQAAVCRENVKKKFKLRNENDASACLYPPTSSRNYWTVCDFGGPEGERYFTPIDIVMRERGLEFWPALMSLAEEYGINVKLSSNVNKPIITQRMATEDEVEGQEHITLREGFTAEGLAVWGYGIKAEVLRKLGWSEVDQIVKTNNRTTTIITRTENFPIFCQRCYYRDNEGAHAYFDKIYQPLNPQKQFRFHYIGTKPQGYIFGLDAVMEESKDNGGKCRAVFLVSGGSDAVACWSRGYPAVYMGSERDIFGLREYKQVASQCEQLYNIPDIDLTGIEEGRRKALELPDMKTIWLNEDEMFGIPDKRGGKRKDLKDYLDLHHEPDIFLKLMKRALDANIFIEVLTNGGKSTKIVISPTVLDYYLWLHGFCTLRDDKNEAPHYLHFKGIKVRRVVSKTIKTFILNHAEKQGWDRFECDLLRKSKDLPSPKSSTLREIPQVDILRATPDMQPMFFRNCWIKVTKDGVERHSYSELSDQYIWENRIIPHDYIEMPKMFEISRDDKGNYHVTFPNGMPSKVMQVLVNTTRLHWRKKDEQNLELTDVEKAEEALCLVSRITNAGYHLHTYKSASAAYATVCVDYKMGKDKGEQNGRTGKSFYLETLGKLLNGKQLIAKKKDVVESKFFFGDVTEENALVIIDECHEHLDISQYNGYVTGDFSVEQKNQPAYTIPFEDSPRLAFATNYVLNKHDQTTEGRFWFQTFSDYYHFRTDSNDYHETRKIKDDIGCDIMMSGYPERDWQLDIAFYVQCLQYHLSLPDSEWRIDPPMTQIRHREMQASIYKDVAEWAEDYLNPKEGHLNKAIPYKEVFDDFVKETKSNISPRTFTLQLKAFCTMVGLVYNPSGITGKEKDGESYVARFKGYTQSQRSVFIQSKSNDTNSQIISNEDDHLGVVEGEIPF